jgi:periplasmic protein TonB
MFDIPPTARRRPMFGASAALHAALGLALVVPPLFATEEPPEPQVRVPPLLPVATVNIGDERARAPVDLLRMGNEGRAKAPASHATSAAARPALVQPQSPPDVLPPPTGDEPDSPFEETGERSEPGKNRGLGTPGAGDDADGGDCEGCKIISATASGVTPPVPLETVSPAYPEPARRAHVEGVVMLEAIIGTDGTVRDVRVLSVASPLLDPAALDAVRRWRYRPARIGQRLVPVYLSVVVTFSLKNL